MKLSISGLLNL